MANCKKCLFKMNKDITCILSAVHIAVSASNIKLEVIGYIITFFQQV